MISSKRNWKTRKKHLSMKKHLHPFIPIFSSFILFSYFFSSFYLSTISLNHWDKVKNEGGEGKKGMSSMHRRQTPERVKKKRVRMKGRESEKERKRIDKKKKKLREKILKWADLNVFHSENEEGRESVMALFEHMRTLRCLRCRGMSQGGNPIAPHIQTCQLWEQWEGGGDFIQIIAC